MQKGGNPNCIPIIRSENSILPSPVAVVLYPNDLNDGEGDGNIVFPPRPPSCTHHVGRGFIYSWAGLRRGSLRFRR